MPTHIRRYYLQPDVCVCAQSVPVWACDCVFMFVRVRAGPNLRWSQRRWRQRCVQVGLAAGRDKGAPLAGSPAKPRPAAEATTAGEAGLLSTSARRAEAAEAAKPCLKV